MAMSRRRPEPIRERVPLSRYTTMRVGGPARYFAQVGDADLVVRLAQWARDEEVRWVVLGEGSNVICADDGYDGLVIVYHDPAAQPAIETTEDESATARVVADACLPLANLARWTARHGLSGLEWAAGIPGTAGGAIVGNAGAFGTSMADVVLDAEVVRSGGRTRESAASLGLAYRTSALAQEVGPLAVLRVGLGLQPDDASSCLGRLEQFGRARRRSQPGGPSSGCVFRNPPGRSAGRLLDQCGLKGHAVGDAVYSDRHANFVINRGNATAADVVGLMQVGREAVWRRFGVMLEPEVRFLGGLTLGRLE